MEKALSKDKLLELYLNEIFLGQRSYGVAAAALTYFDKSLEELDISEAAYLAALPKAPNNYHPVRKHDRAVTRRNWVINRMAEDGHITSGQAELAKAKPLIMSGREIEGTVSAPYFSEEVRRDLEKKYGEDSLYKGGLAVRTTVDPKLQAIAIKSLRDGLMEYDKRHGWRGPVATIDDAGSDWKDKLGAIAMPAGILPQWDLVIVRSSSDSRAKLGFKDGSEKDIEMDGVVWARKCVSDCYGLGPEITSVKQVLVRGDVVMVEKVKDKYVLRQIPKIEGAIIAMDPHTGRVLAMEGGWQQGTSIFNRATQASRQPGSAFKPFVYLAALDKGFTPATRVLDAPFVIEQAPGDFWRPTNYSGEFYGPTPIRVGVEKSRNLMTVRLADHIGMETVVDYAQRFGIADHMKPYLSYALGAGETTLLRLTTAYAMLVNGGKRITPTFIDRIQDRRGKTVFRHDDRPCPNCGTLIRWDGQETPAVPDEREQVSDPRTTYQLVSILEGVAQRGTAAKLAALGRPLAGKTGTTNESKDTWFIGFSPDLTVGVFVGFDEPKSMGKRETGGSAALPIFQEFMGEALKDVSPAPFRIPPGVKLVRINAATGRTAMPGDPKVIWEAFVTGTEPNVDDYVLDTDVISGGAVVDPQGADPYGYGNYQDENAAAVPQQLPGGPTYQGQGVETYSVDDPMTTFSRPDQTNPGPVQPIQPGQAQPPVAPVPAPSTDPSLTGTGGLY
jgi:penicillin-binding protein 1A